MPFQQVNDHKEQTPFSLNLLPWPNKEDVKVKVIAPHPDDFDAIAVSLKMFEKLHYSIEVYVLSGGSKGVQDVFVNSNDWDIKAKVREQEQLKSTRLFGLNDEKVHFLRLPEAEDGELNDRPESQRILAEAIIDDAPSIWCLPYGQDTNTAHQRTYRMAKSLAQQYQHPILLLCNKDAKTLTFETHYFMEFGESEAQWKGQLLRCHQSQQSRNINIRGYGFDERVLRFNRATAQALNTKEPYTEAFHAELIK